MSFSAFQSIASSKLRFGFFMLVKLPAAFFSGVRVRELKEEEAVVSVPFKWLTQNPFKSTYFASQAMAAEMSTGLLALGQLYKREPKVSMLVTGLKATYFKKATERIYFTCADGLAIKSTIEKAIETGIGQEIAATSIGRNQQGDIVSEFVITWSFKARK